MTLEVREVAEAEAPVALLLEQHGWEPDGETRRCAEIPMRWFDGRLWTDHAFWHQNEAGRKLYELGTPCLGHGHGGYRKREEQLQAAREWEDSRILIGEQCWQVSKEPVYRLSDGYQRDFFYLDVRFRMSDGHILDYWPVTMRLEAEQERDRLNAAAKCEDLVDRLRIWETEIVHVLMPGAVQFERHRCWEFTVGKAPLWFRCNVIAPSKPRALALAQAQMADIQEWRVETWKTLEGVQNPRIEIAQGQLTLAHITGVRDYL